MILNTNESCMFNKENLQMYKSILFICSANKQRSKTVEDYFSSKYQNINFYSAGTNKKICQREGTNYLEIETLRLVDIIFVMEQTHKIEVLNFIEGIFKKEIIVLNIPDIYRYYQKVLIESWKMSVYVLRMRS